MNDPAQATRVVRFDTFELNLKTGELRKGGIKIRLQEQSFQILAALLERPGKLVTRETLQERLWPEDTFVDFDKSLNIAVSKLRQALGDSADEPRFIETLPRRGYRFTGTIEQLDATGEIVGLPGGDAEERRISHYRLLEKLGEGGMGVVHKAEDTKLGRTVALKFLAPHLLRDEEARVRFEREARAAATLDHPNICTVYEIDQADGETFIALAYLDGQTLGAKIAEGPLKIPEALAVATQLAEGLGAAHEQGVIHRDMKPDNVMLVKGSRGLAKIMDFGLAQLAGASKLTREGTTLGTMSYMSPEQAEGGEIDHRSDIWSLGVILYEMVAGQPPFRGEFDQAVLYSILNEAPEPLTAVRTGVPKELERIVGKALAKRSESRYQHVEDLLAELGDLKREQDIGNDRPAAPAPLRVFKRATWLVAATVLALVVILSAAVRLGFFERIATERDFPPASFTPVPVTASPDFEYHAAVSPDGERVAFSRTPDLRLGANIYVRTIGSDDDPIRLTEDGKHNFSPTWAPDGNYLAFVRFTPERSEIVRIPSIGGPEKVLGELAIPADFPSFNLVFKYLDWSPDGQFLAVAQHGEQDSPRLYKLEIATGKQTPLPHPAVGFIRDPAYAPKGRAVAYAGFQEMDSANIWLLDLAETGEPVGEPKQVTRHASFINGLDWTADGREIVFSSGLENVQRLWRVPIEADEPPTVQVGGELGRSPSTAAHSNRLVYERRDYDTNIWRLPGPLARNQGPAASARIVSSTQQDGSLDFSPDGERIVFVSSRTGNPELWTAAADGSDKKRITSWNGPNLGSPRWSPDGQFIAFDANSSRDIYVVRSSGGQTRRLTTSDSHDIRPAWSRDGEWIYFCSPRTGKWAIWKTPLAGGEPIRVTDEGGFEFYESSDGSLYFHSSIKGKGDVRRLPAGGGASEHVLAEVESAKWTGFDGGICFAKEDDSGPTGLWYHDFSTRDTRRFGELPKAGGSINGSPGLSVSPDGKQIVLSFVDRTPESDIVMLDDFR